MRMVGGLQIGAPAPGDYSFMANLFERLTKEVKHAGSLTRYVGYLSGDPGEDQLHLFGIEVDFIDDIPEGMMAWELGDDRITVWALENGKNTITWRDNLIWQWRQEYPSTCGRGLMGEFAATIPPSWTSTGNPEVRSFLLTANAYVAPGREGCDDGIYLVDYDPSWPQQFEEMADWIRRSFGPEIIALRVEHYGSTAIPGLCAKPIIDLLVEIPSFAEAKRRVLPLLNNELWEYWFYSGHLTFIKRKELMGQRTHHIHMAPAGHEIWTGLAFRDYLRSHPEDAARYAALKRTLAKSHRQDRERYTQAKADFVKEITARPLKH